MNAVRPTLDLILTAPESVASLSHEVITQLLTESTTISALLAARLASAPSELPRAAKESDDWLDIDTAANRIGKTRRWIFKHACELPFVRRVSKKTLLCSARGIEKWLANRARA